MREHDTFSRQIKTTVSLWQEPQSLCIFRLRLQFRNRLLLLGERDVAGLEGQFVDAKDAGMLKKEIPAETLPDQIGLADTASPANCYQLRIIRSKGGLQLPALIDSPNHLPSFIRGGFIPNF